MKARTTRGRWFASALGLALLAACSGSGPARPDSTPAHEVAPPAEGEAVITGTTLDAATGEPLADVEIEGPGGAKAVSGPDGRFVLRGLAAGEGGELRARSKDGREASNVLTNLQNSRLEVVLHLR